MPASRRHGKRKPPDQSTRTDQQRQCPHINANRGESRRFYYKCFNASSRSAADEKAGARQRGAPRRFAPRQPLMATAGGTIGSAGFFVRVRKKPSTRRAVSG